MLTSESPIPTTPVDPPPTFRPEAKPFWIGYSVSQQCLIEEDDLAVWLESIKMQDLRRMAAGRGWQVRGSRKADIIAHIVPQMTDAAEIYRAVRELDDEHRRVLAAMLLSSGESAPESIAAILASWGNPMPPVQIAARTEYLCELGLAVPGQMDYGYPIEPAFVHSAVARHLSLMLDEIVPVAGERSPKQAAPAVHLADPFSLLRAAHQIVTVLEQQVVTLRPPMPRPDLTGTGQVFEGWDYDPFELQSMTQGRRFQAYTNLSLNVPPPARSLPDEAIEQLLPFAGSEARLEFIFSLLVASGVFQPGSPVTVWQDVKRQFLQHNEPGQWAILARVYFAMSNWNALWEVLRTEPELQLRRRLAFDLKPQQLREALSYFRHLVLHVLACLPDDKWIRLDALLPLMRALWPGFDEATLLRFPHHVHPFQNIWFLARSSTKRALSVDPDEDWDLAQRNFILQVISGPLHWLGLADLSYAGDALAEVRFHGLGDLFWDRVETPAVPSYVVGDSTVQPPDEAIVIDEYTIVVDPTAIKSQAHDLLNSIARLDEATPRRFTYTLDAQAVHGAFELGQTIDDLRSGWERLLPVPMPDQIRNQLEAWWEAYGQVRIYENVTIIEFGDDLALAEMKAVTSLSDHLIAEVSPRLVLISEASVDALIAELERAGYTPKQVDRV